MNQGSIEGRFILNHKLNFSRYCLFNRRPLVRVKYNRDGSRVPDVKRWLWFKSLRVNKVLLSRRQLEGLKVMEKKKMVPKGQEVAERGSVPKTKKVIGTGMVPTGPEVIEKGMFTKNSEVIGWFQRDRG
jgi:hypothetical protein